MVIKKKSSVFGEQTPEIQLPKWMLTKWFLYIATAVMVVLFVGFSLPASTRDNIADAVFAKTATDVSGTGPKVDAGKIPPIITESATPTSTEGKEKTIALEDFSASGAIKKIEYRTQDKNQEREIGKALVNIYNGAYNAEILIDKNQIENINLKMNKVEFSNFKISGDSVGSRLLTASIKGTYKKVSLRIESYKDLPYLKVSDYGHKSSPEFLGRSDYDYISSNLPSSQIRAIVPEWTNAKYIIIQISLK